MFHFMINFAKKIKKLKTKKIKNSKIQKLRLKEKGGNRDVYIANLIMHICHVPFHDQFCKKIKKSAQTDIF